ncbi:MAG: hypothetical protein IPG88_08005 [Gemmatimonadetes bacterium]|nr:hypothetical protein [Gemmatimonadota bacterium]
MPLGEHHAQASQVGRPAGIAVAAGDRHTAPNEQFRQRGHAGASDADEVHRPGIGRVEEGHGSGI